MILRIVRIASLLEHYLTRCTKGVRAKIYKAIPAQEMLWFSETFQREALTLRKK